ncbi:Hemicentin-1 [Labeo rohita]|uniref:Hemicentin-1 n=1 Tax=Labeo rohita TaxID=84645 RepID=A0ABQ8LIY0_LABRO|nr:Hemicentin-1 [Labeo rohita]
MFSRALPLSRVHPRANAATLPAASASSSDTSGAAQRDSTKENNIELMKYTIYNVADAVKKISVMEGDSVTLNTDVTEVQKYLLIQWMFGSTRIAEFNRLTQTISIYESADGKFRDRLKLGQTGSLTIANTRTTDSGLYQLTAVGEETKYKRFNVTVYEYPQNTSSPESSSSSNRVTSSFVVNNSTVNQTEDNNNTECHQPSSDNIHCCGSTEAVIRLALSALITASIPRQVRSSPGFQILSENISLSTKKLTEEKASESEEQKQETKQ